MPIDTQITVLLLLKDMAAYTFRWMAYANATRFPFKVLIADGGADGGVEEILSDPRNYPHVDFEYVRYPYDATLSQFYAKKADALARIDTPYVVKATNDDFYFVDGIRKAVRFLSANPEFVSARGTIYDFILTSASADPSVVGVYGEIQEVHQFKQLEESNTQETATRRVAKHCAYYVTCWHDVHRTPNLRRWHEILCSLDPHDLRICDHVTDFHAVAAGKVHRGLFPYMLRQSNPVNGTGAALATQFSTWRDWMATPWWKEDASRFADSVAAEIARTDGIQIVEARAGMWDGYVNVCLRQKIAEDSERRPSFRSWLKARIRAVMPSRHAASATRSLYRMVRAVRTRRRHLTARALAQLGGEAVRIAEFVREVPNGGTTCASSTGRAEGTRKFWNGGNRTAAGTRLNP